MSERPTPYSIAVCALIALHSDPSSPLYELEFSNEEQDDLTSFLEDCACGKESGVDLRSLLRGVRQRLGPGVESLLEETLEMAAESIDALIDLMDSLRVAITEGLVDSVSSHGVFLRMVCLGFEELYFESAALLWEALKGSLYKSDETAELVLDASESTSWPLSTRQIENTLSNDCLDLQQGKLADSDLSFESVELKIRSMMEISPESPAAYFFRFLNCLHHRERVGTMDALHQYFDQATVQHNSPKDILQFSAILLAVAHGSFGDSELSLMATEEAVRVAQQSKDKDAACVAFALGWLFENNGHGTAERQELLTRCAARALQRQLRPLVAGANLALAKHFLDDDRRSLPSSAWTRLTEVTSEQAADSLSNLDRPTFMSLISSQAMESLARQALLSAAMWDSFNMPTLSGLSSTVALRYDQHLPSEDVATAIQNVSRLSLHGVSLKLLPGETLEQVAAPFRGECIYAQSIAALVRLQTDYGLDQSGLRGPLLLAVMLVLHEWAVNRGDLEDARALSIAFDSTLHSGLSNFDQLFIDFEIQRCLRLCRERDWERARKIAECALQECIKRGLKSQRARLLIHLSTIELESNSRELMAALSPLLEVLSMCEKHEMHGFHAAALSVLAKVFLRLQNPKRALAILKAAIPTLMEREHLWYQADAFLTLSKCHIQLANTHNIRLKRQHLKTAALKLASSRILFGRCHDFYRLKEVFYLQARVFSHVEDDEEREACSRSFLNVSKHLNMQHGTPSTILASLSNSDTLKAVLNRSIPV